MLVRLILFGHLVRYLPPGSEGQGALLDVAPSVTVADVLDSVDLPRGERSYVTVNGERASLDERLSDGDEVRVIVPLGGG
jgi:sulfur carrier protein ThiS